MEQVEAGMRMVRLQSCPFLPSPPVHIKWCREGRSVLGVTTADVMAEYWKWRKLVFRYLSSEQYPAEAGFITTFASSCGVAELMANSVTKSLSVRPVIFWIGGKSGC